jgi:hypothetical protein
VRPGPHRSLVSWTVGVGRAVSMLAMTGLLAGCLGTSGGPSSGPGSTGTAGTSGGGNGYGGNAGSGGNGGNGYGGWGGNGYGGTGGNADGGADVFSDAVAVAGSGRLISRPIDLSGVTSVITEANFVVHLRTGGPGRAVVTMDDNLADRVDATVTGDQLRLGIKPGTSVRDATLSAELTVRQLDRLATSGASRVILTPTVINSALQLVVSGASAVTGGVSIGRLQAAVSGAGTLGLSGQAQDLRLSAAGASRLPLADLTVRSLDATLSGASHVTITVNETLAAQATGASVLRYRGTPNVTRSQTSGISSLVQDSP